MPQLVRPNHYNRAAKVPRQAHPDQCSIHTSTCRCSNNWPRTTALIPSRELEALGDTQERHSLCLTEHPVQTTHMHHSLMPDLSSCRRAKLRCWMS